MKDNKWYLGTITYILKAFLITWSLTVVSGFGAGNIFSVVFLCFGILILNAVSKHENANQERVCGKIDEYEALKRRKCIMSTFLSAIFTVFYTLVDGKNWVADFDNKLFKLIIGFVVFVGMVILFSNLIVLLFGFIDHVQGMISIEEESSTNNGTSTAGISNKQKDIVKIFWISAALCFVCYVPYFLYLFPGVMTPDSVVQLEQAVGMEPLTNHHPFVHTLIIRLFYNIGNGIFGNKNMGVAVYTLAQMMIGALSYGYVVSTLKKIGLPKWVYITTVLFFALIPYNAVFAVTMWKDVMFGYAVMIFSVALLRTFLVDIKYDYILLGISGFFVCLMRSNGWYGFVVFSIIYIIYMIIKKKILPGVPVIIAVIIAVMIVKYPVMNSFNITNADFVESLSVPLQQVACVLVNGRELDENEQMLVDNLIDTTYIAELYEPTFADNIKELVRAGHPEYLESHKKDYLMLYISLGLKYPGDYIDAYTGQVGGYWFPENIRTVADTEGICGNDIGVYSTPLIGGKIVVKLKEILLKLGNLIPVYGVIWSVGTIFWILLLAMGYHIYRKKWDLLMALMPCFLLTMTIFIATPVSGNFRYVYYMVVLIPIMVASILVRRMDNT